MISLTIKTGIAGMVKISIAIKPINVNMFSIDGVFTKAARSAKDKILQNIAKRIPITTAFFVLFVL